MEEARRRGGEEAKRRHRTNDHVLPTVRLCLPPCIYRSGGMRRSRTNCQLHPFPRLRGTEGAAAGSRFGRLSARGAAPLRSARCRASGRCDPTPAVGQTPAHGRPRGPPPHVLRSGGMRRSRTNRRPPHFPRPSLPPRTRGQAWADLRGTKGAAAGSRFGRLSARGAAPLRSARCRASGRRHPTPAVLSTTACGVLTPAQGCVPRTRGRGLAPPPRTGRCAPVSPRSWSLGRFARSVAHAVRRGAGVVAGAWPKRRGAEVQRRQCHTNDHALPTALSLCIDPTLAAEASAAAVCSVDQVTCGGVWGTGTVPPRGA
jgi:hypothetical protein